MTDILQEFGTQINWGSAGGETETITIKNVATGAGREGEEHDFSDPTTIRWRWYFQTKFQAGPTAGRVVRIYMAYSHDGTSYDGDHSGTDAALGNVDQLPNMTLLGVHVCRNNTNTQWSGGIFFLQTEWGAPCIYNDSGQTFTNVDADHELILEPCTDEIQ